jgi:HlyD family secretion protein
MNAPVHFPPYDRASPYQDDDPVSDRSTPKVKSTLRFALISILLFLAIFAFWSWSAPLNSAAIAPGVLEAAGGGRRTVQHLEGGIVRQFLVTDGQEVRAGDPLVLLDTVQSDARDAAVRSTFYGLLAQDARLTAERRGLRAISYPTELLAAADRPEVKAIIAASDAVFATRLRGLSEQTSILTQRLGQASAEIRGSGAQLSALGDQTKLLEDEEYGVSTLVEEGLERKSRLLALQRQKATNEGQQGQLTNNLDRLRDTMGETRAQMISLRGQMAMDAATQQRDVQMQIAEAREKMKVSSDIRGRQQILAPITGRVTNLRLITPGGVIGAGQPVLDIVPSDEKIVVTARLKANDIDVVHPGLKADVKLTPYKARVMPNLHGVVREVSADATFDEDSRQLYYKVVIEIRPNELKHFPDVRLMSGMPTEVFIDLGSNSLLQFLLQPMIDSFNRAFRES